MHQHLVDAFVDATLRWHSLETNSGERWTHNGPRSDAAAAPLLLVRDTSKFGATSVNDVKLGVGGEREAKPGDTLFVGGETKLLLLWEPLVIVVPRSVAAAGVNEAAVASAGAFLQEDWGAFATHLLLDRAACTPAFFRCVLAGGWVVGRSFVEELAASAWPD